MDHTNAQESALNGTDEIEVLTLSDDAREIFVDAVLSPPLPNEAARKAAQQYKERLRR